jgi:hypothetical protein
MKNISKKEKKILLIIFLLGFLCGLIFFNGCTYPLSNSVRNDYYDINSKHTGYSISEDGRTDYYDINSNRMGYSY